MPPERGHSGPSIIWGPRVRGGHTERCQRGHCVRVSPRMRRVHTEKCSDGLCLLHGPRVRGSHDDAHGGHSICHHCLKRRQRASWWRDESQTPPPTWLYLTVWLAAVLVYLNGLTGDFVHDDVSAIKTNQDVLGTTPLSHVFFNDYWGKPMSNPRSHKSYRPLTILTFRWSHTVLGLRPFGFHLVNVLLHSCACLLLTRLLLRLFNLPQGTVLSAGLIFATHPIHTEAVTGLVGRADVLASLSFMAALLSYHRAIELARDGPSEEVNSEDEGSSDGDTTWEGCSRRQTGLYEGGGGRNKFRRISSFTEGDGGGSACRKSPGISDVGGVGNTCRRLSNVSEGGSESCNTYRRPQSVYEEGGGSTSRSPGISEAGSNTYRRPPWFSECGGAGCGTTCSNKLPHDHTRRKSGLVENREGDQGSGGHEDQENKVWLRWTGVWAGIGTLCKEHAFTALAVCAAWDVILHKKHIWRLASRRPANTELRTLGGRLLWLFIMGLVIMVGRVWVMRGSSPMFSDQDNPASCHPSILTRTLTLWYLPAVNAWLLLCPWSLSHDWQVGSVPLLTSPADPRNMATILLLLTVLLVFRAGCFTKGNEGRAILLSLALVILPFIPASNLFVTVGFVVAERVLYIPSLGYSVLVAVGLSRAGRLRAPGLMLLLVVFSFRTLQRNRDWQSRETLFIAGLRTLPHNAKMHYNFANLQKDLGHTNLARHHYQEAIRLWPGHSSAHNNLGTLISDVTQAEAHFRLALKAHPHHANAYYNLANLRKQQGRIGEAVSLLEKSVRYDATNRDAVSTLAGLYSDDGRFRDAENLHLTLLEARPSDPLVHNNYATFLHKIGRREAALVHYEAALGLDPQHTVALVNSAALMTSLKQNTQAERLYKRALAVSWEAEVGESLGKLYLNTGRLEEAVAAFTTVLALHPHRLSTRVWMARVKVQQRSYLESEELLTDVLDRDPNHQEALFQLSLLYTHTNRTQAALTIAQRAAHNCSDPPTLCARFHAHYGDLLNDIHDSVAAVQSYQLAVELEPTLTHAHVNLGALYHTKGDYARAWRHYLTAHGQEPSNTLLLENLEKLRRAQHLQPSAAPSRCLTIAASYQP